MANGIDGVPLRASEGDFVGAIKEIDDICDGALEVEERADLRNEVECRRLEARVEVSMMARDLRLFAECLQEIGKSRRFSKERLHENIEFFGASMKHMLEKLEQ